MLNVLGDEFYGNGDNNGDDGQQFPGDNTNCYFNEQMITAKFILSLEVVHKVSSAAVDSIVSSTRSLMSEMLEKLSMRVMSIPGIDGFLENIQGLFSENNAMRYFNNLPTHQHRHTFYREQFLLIPPEKCLLEASM